MTLTLHALSEVPEVGDGDDLVEITLAALGADELALQPRCTGLVSAP